MKRKSAFILLCMALLAPGQEQAAPAPRPSVTGRALQYVKTNVNLSGSASALGEFYHASGISNRLPATQGRFMLNANLTVLNLMSVSADAMLSTDQSYARQDMNFLGLHPTWKWGRAHLGDFSDNLSNYTFNGVSVRGAELDLFPGLFRFTAAGGRTKRAVEGDLTTQSYAQYLYAGRAGYGDKSGNFIDVIGVKVRDDASSLDKSDLLADSAFVNPDTLETELDTLWLKPPENPYAITPQENAVAGIAGQLCLFNKRLILGLEASGEVFTKDMNAPAIPVDSIGLPGFTQTLFENTIEPRRGSATDFAVAPTLQLNLPQVRAKAGYSYVGPGYVSLAAPSVMNDRQEISLNTAFAVKKNRVQLDWNRLTDNLLDQKTMTNTRNQFRTSVSSSLGKWQSQVGLALLLMNNDADTDSLEWAFRNLTFNTYQGLVFARGGFFRQAGVQYTFQRSDRTQWRKETDANYHTGNIFSSMKLADPLSLNASVGLSYRDPEAGDSYVTQVYSLRLSHTALKNRLSNAVYASSSMVRTTRVFRAGASSSFMITTRNQAVSDVSYNIIQGTQDSRELRASLSLSHRL